ncbi:hypothetical protein RRG08_001237 [Elysia crispata]|uniref:Uncharacterized protein n=1 Tax=Elysia crispata TaxID=231223 RepID=A0AAE1B7R0_9GAST|nr:hypothetical protein RRG08_001237 [Elysia crispata]
MSGDCTSSSNSIMVHYVRRLYEFLQLDNGALCQEIVRVPPTRHLIQSGHGHTLLLPEFMSELFNAGGFSKTYTQCHITCQGDNDDSPQLNGINGVGKATNF